MHRRLEVQEGGREGTDSPTNHVDLFRRMCLIRSFEERTAKLYKNADIPGFVHTSIGQEAVAVGICASLRKEDYVATTHRAHGHCLAKGVDVNKMMAELFGKVTGICRGKGGSMHIADPSVGILGANAIVGASLPLATGAALAARKLGTDRVAVAFFGDGAVNQGAYHEAVNLAAMWDLPVLFACENNRYSEFTESDRTSRRKSVLETASSYGIGAMQVDGNDVEAVLSAAVSAVAACRDGKGPILIEALTYRWSGHYEGDAQGYRPVGEVEEWKQKDPLVITANRIKGAGLAKDADLDSIRQEVVAMVDAAERFARESDFPEPTEAFYHVFQD